MWKTIATKTNGIWGNPDAVKCARKDYDAGLITMAQRQVNGVWELLIKPSRQQKRNDYFVWAVTGLDNGGRGPSTKTGKTIYFGYNMY